MDTNAPVCVCLPAAKYFNLKLNKLNKIKYIYNNPNSEFFFP